MDDVEKRLRYVQEQAADLRRRLEQTVAVHPRTHSPLQMRLAKTAVDPSDNSYPGESSEPLTYFIKFLDGAYANTAGADPATFTERQPDALAKAKAVARGYIEPDTVIAVFLFDHAWWIADSGNNAAEEMVAVTGSGSTGDPVAANGACLWGGSLVTINAESGGYCSDPFIIGSAVWLLAVDKPGGSGTPGATLIQGDRYIAHHLGTFTVSSDTRPLYAIRKGGTGSGNPFILFQLTAKLHEDDAAAAAVSVAAHWGGSDPGATVDVTNLADGGSFTGQVDDLGIATWNDVDEQWQILYLPGIARVIECTVGGFSAGVANMVTSVTGHHGSTPTSPYVHDPQGLFTRALSGAKCVAVFQSFKTADDPHERYLAQNCQTKAGRITITLTADLPTSGVASVTITSYGGTQQDIQNPGSGPTVKDATGEFKGAKLGYIGEAIYDAPLDEYHIVSLQQKARRIHFTLQSPVAKSTISFNANVTIAYQGVAPTGTVVVNNFPDPTGASGEPYLFKGPSGYPGTAEYDEITGVYWCNWIKCSDAVIPTQSPSAPAAEPMEMMPGMTPLMTESDFTPDPIQPEPSLLGM